MQTTLKPFTPIPMQERDTIVMEKDSNITIYHVMERDAGVYRCRSNDTLGGIVILEVIDDDNYTVVYQGHHSSPPKLVRKDLVVFSLWSLWRECSVCGPVGKKIRYGICHVKVGKLFQN